MIVVTIPYTEIVRGGTLHNTAVDMNLLGFEPISTNDNGMCFLIQKTAFKLAPSELIANAKVEELVKIPTRINNFVYNSILTKNEGTNLLMSICNLGGQVNGIMFYGKAPKAYLTRSMPIGYPLSSYTIDDIETQYTYGEYKFKNSGEIKEMGEYIYFPMSKYNGGGPVDGTSALLLESDNVEILSKNQYSLIE